MKLRKGSDILKPVAPIGIIVSICVVEQMNHYSINMVSMNQLNEMRAMARTPNKKLEGMPHCFAVSKETGFLHFFPATNKTREIEIYYHPPVMKM